MSIAKLYLVQLFVTVGLLGTAIEPWCEFWRVRWTAAVNMQQPGPARPMLSQSDFTSPDCSGLTPNGYTRIFIAERRDGKSGDGSASDPFDGSSAQKFDTLLRSRSEAGVTHLIVCIGPGTFLTEGTGDYVVDEGRGHLEPSHPAGFTVNDHWRIHGFEMDQTTLRLADLFFDPVAGNYLQGVIIGTYSFEPSGIEVSDLTLDDNYPVLKPRYRSDLALLAVTLRSNRGHQWIHNIHVLNASGERGEDFPVAITSPAPSPDNQGNIIEHVTMDHWAGGRCTAITIAGGEGEVRNNKVVGYHIGYGGWSMSNVNFHDNQAIETTYGFNIDSWQNKGIVIAHNEIVHPKFGVVVGGNGDFTDFSILDNTITAGTDTMNGLVFQGHVKGAHVLRNKIIPDQGGTSSVLALYEKGTENIKNIFQENVISDSFKNSLEGADCVYRNVSEAGREMRSLRNSQNTPCEAE